jgi:NTE family protein
MGISNLNKGIMEYRNTGNLADVVLASASIPILFSPVKIGSDFYVDGGLLDNIPIKPILKMCEQIISVNISPVVPENNLKNLKQIASRTFYMSVNAAISEVKKASAIYIEPEGIEKYEILSMSHTEELFELGYRSAKKILEETKLLAS